MNLGYIKKVRNNLNNSCNYLNNIKIPTSIIWANDDKIFPIRIAEKLNKRIKNSKLLVVEGNDDWVFYDENKFINYLNTALK